MSAASDKKLYDLGKWGVPRKLTACPGCGYQYGSFRRMVCVHCEECSKCCACSDKQKDHRPAELAVPVLLERNS